MRHIPCPIGFVFKIFYVRLVVFLIDGLWNLQIQVAMFLFENLVKQIY